MDRMVVVTACVSNGSGGRMCVEWWWRSKACNVNSRGR